MAAAASHPFLPDYDSRSCRDDAPAPAWQTDVPDSASECCERYFAHPAGACEEATRAWIARSRGEAPKEYYPDPAHGLCKVATAATPAWITAREGDREACCRTHLGWNLEGCLAAAPGRAREGPASGPPADRSSYGADHGEDSRLIAYVGSWQACPTPAQTDSYSHIVIAYAVSYTWSLAKNNCHDQCAIASTVPICENQNQQALVDQWRAAGKKVLLSFGGAGMGRSWSDDPNNCWDYCFGKEDELSTALVDIIDNQRFDGIDIDYEYCYDIADKQAGKCRQRTAAYSDRKAQTFLNDLTAKLRSKLDALQRTNGYDRGRYEVTHAPMDSDLTPSTSAYFRILHDRRADLDFLMPQFYNGVTRPALGLDGTGGGEMSAASFFGSLSNDLFDAEPHKVVFGHCISDCSVTDSNVNAGQAVQITSDLKEINGREFACNGGAFFWVAMHDAGGEWSNAVVTEVSKTAGCSEEDSLTPPTKPAPVSTQSGPGTDTSQPLPVLAALPTDVSDKCVNLTRKQCVKNKQHCFWMSQSGGSRIDFCVSPQKVDAAVRSEACAEYRWADCVSAEACRYDAAQGCLAEEDEEEPRGGPGPGSASCPSLTREECARNSARCQWHKKSACTAIPGLARHSSPFPNLGSGSGSGSGSESSSVDALPALVSSGSSNREGSSAETRPVIVKHSSLISVGGGGGSDSDSDSNSANSSNGGSGSNPAIECATIDRERCKTHPACTWHKKRKCEPCTDCATVVTAEAAQDPAPSVEPEGFSSQGSATVFPGDSHASSSDDSIDCTIVTREQCEAYPACRWRRRRETCVPRAGSTGAVTTGSAPSQATGGAAFSGDAVALPVLSNAQTGGDASGVRPTPLPPRSPPATTSGIGSKGRDDPKHCPSWDRERCESRPQCAWHKKRRCEPCTECMVANSAVSAPSLGGASHPAAAAAPPVTASGEEAASAPTNPVPPTGAWWYYDAADDGCKVDGPHRPPWITGIYRERAECCEQSLDTEGCLSAGWDSGSEDWLRKVRRPRPQGPLGVDPNTIGDGFKGGPLTGSIMQKHTSGRLRGSGGYPLTHPRVYYPDLDLGGCRSDGAQGDTLDLYDSSEECCRFPWMPHYDDCMIISNMNV